MALSRNDDLIENRYTRAKEHVAQIKGFYINVICAVSILPALAVLNYWIDQWENPWFLFSVGGWSVGILMHGLATFQPNIIFGKEWENNKIQEFIAEEDKKRKQWQ